MSSKNKPLDNSTLSQKLLSALYEQDMPFVEKTVASLVPEDIAEILEATPPKERNMLWLLVSREMQGEVLVHTNDEVKASLLELLDEKELLEITEDLATDDITDILQGLPEDEKSKVLERLKTEDRIAVETALSYPEDTAGGLMSTDIITIRSDVSLEVVLRLLRKIGKIPDTTIDLIVRDRER